MSILILTKKGWGTLRASFSQTHPVTLAALVNGFQPLKKARVF
jgi:hypothetical protein